MGKVYIIVFLICFFPYFLFSSEISLVELSDVQKKITNIHKEKKSFSFKNDLQKRRCISYDKVSYFSVSPACFLQKKGLKNISFTGAVDSIVPYLKDIGQIYETEAENFSYQPTGLIRDKEIPSLKNISALQDKFLLGLLHHHNFFIKIPKIMIAKEQIEKYSFYASVRETNTYGLCRKQNYDVAMDALDGLILFPGEELNMNKLIAYLPGYCTGTKGTYMFYQGVCGGSTQLFWNGLVNPYLSIKERHNHSQFWSSFYGQMGEDAGIYEMSKQLVLENKTSNPIYFKTFVREIDGNTVLLSVYPKNEGLISEISKKETGNLSAELKNTIVRDTGDVISEKVWKSRYVGVNRTKD